MLEPIVALSLFVAIFALATVRKVHLGVIMFASAAGVGIWLAGMEMDDVIAGFPVSILVLLVGVTYFFAIAQANGTVDRIITFAISRVGDRAALLPLVFFGLTAGIAAMGSPLAGLVMTPIGMPLAKKYGIDRMLMGLAIGCGLSAGGFAPTSLFGIVTYGTAHSVGIDLNPLTLFSIALVANLVLLLAAYVMFGGLGLLRRRHAGQFGDSRLPNLRGKAPLPGHPFEREGFAERSRRAAQQVQVIDDTVGETTPERFTWAQRTTVLCMAGLVVSVILLAIIGLDPDIGILCFAFATVMTLVDPKTGKTAVSKIDWSTVLMVGGIITFVGVLQEIGAVDLLGEAASQAGAPLVAALCICIIGGLVSAFASTTGMLAALVPLAIPLVADGNIAGWAVIAALGVCSSIVDVSPFSTVGATLVATVDEEERPRITKVLTRWGLSLVVVGPVALVGTLVLPTML
ncbi:SLC13 family permease [Arthrobacter crystallopoietes]|uniref:Di-and tricarboxylate transporter n=1 Tax=Crystallibacter crystallopoietes TaxID=37928 RepID=A0A1H1BTL8_9MICC|nr:SLC13 family permease [Arthrobacter crystallopoietes]AUI51042.1 C4-dicarboxylate ABC transporter [Arthrobacter crystallopoietes]SDQ54756.1 Di-and tricarboxylate transporter [Arthrobacter crystallopoietes]